MRMTMQHLQLYLLWCVPFNSRTELYSYRLFPIHILRAYSTRIFTHTHAHSHLEKRTKKSIIGPSWKLIRHIDFKEWVSQEHWSNDSYRKIPIRYQRLLTFKIYQRSYQFVYILEKNSTAPLCSIITHCNYNVKNLSNMNE